MVNRVVGNVTALKANHLISEFADLQMPAWDVDIDETPDSEHDRVYFNDHLVTREYLTGEGATWKLNTFKIPIEWIHFPPSPNPGESVVPASNTIRIEIDVSSSYDHWCTAIDWVSLHFSVTPPVVLVHGILSGGESWDDPGIWTARLTSAGIPYDNELDMGALDGIGQNAAKIAAEVDAARARWGVEKVNLVCHSKGGLDAREYVNHYPNPGVDQVIQIGTPNLGAPLADKIQGGLVLAGLVPYFLVNYFAGPAGAELTTFHMFAYNLFDRPNPEVRFTCLAGISAWDPDPATLGLKLGESESKVAGCLGSQDIRRLNLQKQVGGSIWYGEVVLEAPCTRGFLGGIAATDAKEAQSEEKRHGPAHHSSATSSRTTQS
jgi:pimeloyl-ACP methyl ester carboxylesterase